MAAPKLLTLDEHDLGLSWVVDEPMQRASHALVADGRVWLVDPVDVPEATERLLALGEPAGVVQLLDRHPRACAELAERYEVEHLRLPDTVPGSPFEVFRVVDVPRWREHALWWPERSALVVAEAVGTHPMFSAGRPAGVHLMLRLRPPGAPNGVRARAPADRPRRPAARARGGACAARGLRAVAARPSRAWWRACRRRCGASRARRTPAPLHYTS
jgi:hypothetical protein